VERIHRPSIIERIIAVLAATGGLEQGYQAFAGVNGGVDPWLLTAEYVVVCITGVVAAYGIWRGRRWGWAALASNGLTTAMLVASLGPILGLPPDARGGLWMGAGTIALLTAIAVWYVRRRARIASRDHHSMDYSNTAI
jgi:hypothetical protein